VSSSDIDIELDVSHGEFVFPFDRRLITQAITNLVKNARESIETRLQNQPEPRGHIEVIAGVNDEHPFIRVTDNGIGLPRENRHPLLSSASWRNMADASSSRTFRQPMGPQAPA